MRTATVEQLRRLDHEAERTYGIPRLLLMEHAGARVARAVQDRCAPSAGRVIVACGRGHNGGDGLAASRLLQQAGYDVAVVLAAAPQAFTGEPAIFLRMVQAQGMPVTAVTSAAEAGAARFDYAVLLVDALLGTGLTQRVQSPYRELIEVMNAVAAPIVSVDVPSGLHADTGRVLGTAVRATWTVTFAATKVGFDLADGPGCTGDVLCDTITFPPALLDAVLGGDAGTEG